MYKLKILFLLLSVSTSLLCQEKIEGIGKFKLKITTTAIINNLIEEQGFNKTSIKSVRDLISLRNGKDLVAEVFPDTLQFYSSAINSHHCKNIRVFYIPKITIANIDIKNMYLTFSKDTLAEIMTDFSAEITDAFDLKYGKSKLDVRETVEDCKSTYSGTITNYTDKIYYQYWDNNDISCTAALGDYRNSKCEKTTIAYINIVLKDFAENTRICDDLEKERLKIANNKLKKKELKDF